MSVSSYVCLLSCLKTACPHLKNVCILSVFEACSSSDDSCAPPVLSVVACFHIQITKHGSNNFGYRAKSASLDCLVMK